MRADLCSVKALVMVQSRCMGPRAWDEDSQRSLLNIVTYSTILKGFAMIRAILNVLALSYEMKGRDVECNAITDIVVRCSVVLVSLKIFATSLF